jgi:hypothetical protein
MEFKQLMLNVLPRSVSTRIIEDTLGRLILRIASHAQYISSQASAFDDHDQVASTLLHAITRFKEWRNSEGAPAPRLLLTLVCEMWSQVNRDQAHIYRIHNPLPFHRPAI